MIINYRFREPEVFIKCLYLSGFLICNFSYSYSDAKKKLDEFRKKNYSEYLDVKDKQDAKYLDSQWSAVKYGAYQNFNSNFLYSLIWPLTMISDIVPYLVLKMNKKTE